MKRPSMVSREYVDASYFITNLMKLESELFRMNENDREKTLLDRITRIVKDESNKVKIIL